MGQEASTILLPSCEEFSTKIMRGNDDKKLLTIIISSSTFAKFLFEFFDGWFDFGPAFRSSFPSPKLFHIFVLELSGVLFLESSTYYVVVAKMAFI